MVDTKNPANFPFTKLVLKGITRMRQVPNQIGVVMGKDVLTYFNSSLDPNKNYMDLLLVCFDLICTTAVCRTGELAPTLSDPASVSRIVTLKHVIFKDTP